MMLNAEVLQASYLLNPTQIANLLANETIWSLSSRFNELQKAIP